MGFKFNAPSLSKSIMSSKYWPKNYGWLKFGRFSIKAAKIMTTIYFYRHELFCDNAHEYGMNNITKGMRVFSCDVATVLQSLYRSDIFSQ
jgi:hypothetical protein